MKGKILTQAQLKALPDDSPVYVRMDAVEREDRYKGIAFTTQIDDGCCLSLGSKDSSFATDWDYRSYDDEDQCEAGEDDSGTTLTIYEWKGKIK